MNLTNGFKTKFTVIVNTLFFFQAMTYRVLLTFRLFGPSQNTLVKGKN